VISLNPKAPELQSSLKVPGLLETPTGGGKADESLDLVGECFLGWKSQGEAGGGQRSPRCHARRDNQSISKAESAKTSSPQNPGEVGVFSFLLLLTPPRSSAARLPVHPHYPSLPQPSFRSVPRRRPAISHSLAIFSLW